MILALTSARDAGGCTTSRDAAIVSPAMVTFPLESHQASCGAVSGQSYRCEIPSAVVISKVSTSVWPACQSARSTATRTSPSDPLPWEVTHSAVTENSLPLGLSTVASHVGLHPANRIAVSTMADSHRLKTERSTGMCSSIILGIAPFAALLDVGRTPTLRLPVSPPTGTAPCGYQPHPPEDCPASARQRW